MTAILYTILGISIGVGVTLIYLQERFVRERRLLVAMGESERAKSAKMLKELDEQWEAECEQYKEELEGCKKRLEELEHSKGSEATISAQDEEKIALLGKELKARQEEYEKLLEENASLKKKLDAAAETSSAGNNDESRALVDSLRQEIGEQQAEVDFLRGEVSRLKEELAAEKEKSARAASAPTLDDDCIVFSKGGHLLPGSIARKLMKRQ